MTVSPVAGNPGDTRPPVRPKSAVVKPGDTRPQAPPKVYTVDTLAETLGVSPRHVRRLIDEGRCPQPFRLGKCVRLSRPVVDEWIAAGCPNCRRRPGGGQ